MVISLASRSASRMISSKDLRRISARSRGIDRGLGVLHGCARDRGDRVLGGGVEDVEPAAVGGFAPFAADPEIGRNIGKEVVVSRTHGCSLTTSNLSSMR